MPIHFEIQHTPFEHGTFYNPSSSLPSRAVQRLADFLLTSRIFSLLTLGHLHTFIHEMGHAVSYVVLTGGKGSATICMSTKTLAGVTRYEANGSDNNLSSAEQTYCSLAGPLADVIFSVVLIVGVFALTHYIHMSPALSLGLKIGIAGPAAFWIFSEFFYAVGDPSGDFGSIANKGWKHLVPSSALILTVCAVAGVALVFLI